MLNVLFRVEMSICLLLELARDWERERERVLYCVAASKEEAKKKKVEGAVRSLLMLPGGGDPGRIA